MEASLPGAFVSFARIGSPASVDAVTASGDNFPSAAFWAGVAAYSSREPRVHAGFSPGASMLRQEGTARKGIGRPGEVLT